MQFTLRQLIAGVGVVGVSLAIFVVWPRSRLEVRAPRTDEKTMKALFGLQADDTEATTNAVISGTFTKSTWLSAWLYLVQGGQVQEVNCFTCGRSPNQIGGPIWQTLNIRLALYTEDGPNGRITTLGGAGFSRSAGSGGQVPNNVEPVEEKLLPGIMYPGKQYLVFVEGDSKFVAEREMTITDFAQKNAGNYFVVVAELH